MEAEGYWLLFAAENLLQREREVISKNNAIAQCLIVGIFANKNGMLKNAFWLHNESNKPSAKAAAHTRQSTRQCRTTQHLGADTMRSNKEV